MNREEFYKLSVSFSRENPPKISGIYAVFLPDRCVYVGQSEDMYNRWFKTSHTRHNQFIFLESLDFNVEYRVIETPINKLDEKEVFWIDCLKPKLNIVKNISVKPKKDKPIKILPNDIIPMMVNNTYYERDRVLIKCLYSLGLRVSEAVNLRWSDFFFDGEFINLSVIGKGQKERTLLVSQSLYSELLKLKREGIDYVFTAYQRNTPLTRQSVNILLTKLQKKLGLETKITPHKFRHSHATSAIKNGCDLSLLQQSLGHSSIKTTERYLNYRKNEGSTNFIHI